jgi:signal transduction histidine kinase
MKWRVSKSAAAYAGLLSTAFALAILASHKFAGELDNYAYDYLLLHVRPKSYQPESIILAIDEATLRTMPGGRYGIRKRLADVLPLVAAAKPKVVAIDLTLADLSQDPKIDARLATIFRVMPNLVLGTELLPDGWDDPLPEFRPAASQGDDWLGEVHAHPDTKDEITRSIHLEMSGAHKQRWALSLQAFRIYLGAQYILQSPQDLHVGGAVVPVPGDEGRRMRVRFATPGSIPRISLGDILNHPALAEKVRGKAVFVGVTAITELQDRLMTPGGRQISGVEIHADAFETMAQRLFILDLRDSMAWIILFSLALTIAAGLSFRFLPGWLAYAGGASVIAAALMAPYVFFLHQRVFSFKIPVSVAVFTVGSAAAYYHLVTRRNWRIEQAARARYQQAMHFVTHEMRTPLSAIQGSSELISRFALAEEKRKQIALLINSESKRLARMVEIFLNVERLSAGQVELKREPIPLRDMIAVCVERVKPLGDRKHIAIRLEPIADSLQMTGDRELMEYACYNLLTNAVKYSPQRTEVTITARRSEGYVRIAVKDQGIGMDQKEVKQIFHKFYRTKKAEESGETGTGIGLSIVQQIVEQHGGRIDVVSEPGAGSCFTLAIPVAAGAPLAATERN